MKFKMEGADERKEGGDEVIFSERNEAGIPLWHLVWLGTKTITRRKKPVEAGKLIAVQPARCHAAICKNCGTPKEWHAPQGNTITAKKLIAVADLANAIGLEKMRMCDHYEPLRVRVTGCELESEWFERKARETGYTSDMRIFEEHNPTLTIAIRRQEAHHEGFASWEGLQAALKRTNPQALPLYRISFEKEMKP